MYAGLQDNGVWSGPSATRHRVGPLNDDWIQVDGGDGMIVTAPPDDPATAYIETQDGRLARFDTATGERTAIRPFEPPPVSRKPGAVGPANPPAGAELRFNWTTPIVVSPHNPLTIYLAGSRLWRSLDRGDHWTAISPDLTKHLDRDKLPIMGVAPSADMLGRNDGITSYGTATAMAESPMKPGLLAVGTDDGLVQISKDGGASWTDVTSHMTGAPDGAWVSGLDWSRGRAGRLYAAFDNHRNDDYRAYLYVSDDEGASWHAAISGLPESPVRSVREDPANANLVFAGTERGLFWSIDAGATWQALKNHLPDVPVLDVEVNPRDRDLVIATHGRGIYIMNIAPLEAWNATVAAEPAHLFEPRPAMAFNVLEHRDFLAQATYVGGNAPSEATLDYSLASDTARATLRITDANGDLVRELQASGAPGLHRAAWDLRLEPLPAPVRPKTDGVDPANPRPAESTHARVPGDFGGGGDPTGGEAGAAPEAPRGPVVPPGRYRVTLVAGNAQATTTLTVVADPRAHASDDDLRARWDLLKRAYDAQRTLIPNLNRALGPRDAVAAVVKALAADTQAHDDLKKFADETAKLTRDAYARLNRVNGQLGSLSRDVAGSTTRPTEAQDAQLAAAVAEVQPAIEQAADTHRPEDRGTERQAEARGDGEIRN